MMIAVGADAAGVIHGRVVGDSLIAFVTLLVVTVAVLVHAWRHH